MPDFSVETAYAPVLRLIESAKERILKSRREMGFHDNEENKWRREKWEITSAKLFSLDFIQEQVAELPEPEYLTGGKSIFSEIERTAELHELHCHFYSERKQVEGAAVHRAKAKALRDILRTLSGSAGTQPKTSEEASTAKEPPSMPNLADYLKALSLADLQAVSELALEAIEERTGGYEWTVADRFRAAVSAIPAGF